MPDADPLGPLRDRGQEHVRGGRQRVVLEEVVLHRPDVVEAHLFGQDALLERLVVGLGLGRPLRVGAADLVDESELHGALLRLAVTFWPRMRASASADRPPSTAMA